MDFTSLVLTFLAAFSGAILAIVVQANATRLGYWSKAKDLEEARRINRHEYLLTIREKLVDLSADIAQFLHEEQTRKASGKPYVAHQENLEQYVNNITKFQNFAVSIGDNEITSMIDGLTVRERTSQETIGKINADCREVIKRVGMMTRDNL